MIGAAARMRPSKSVSDMEPSSLKKKLKDKKFAAGCFREVIREGTGRLGCELDTQAQMEQLGFPLPPETYGKEAPAYWRGPLFASHRSLYTTWNR